MKTTINSRICHQQIDTGNDIVSESVSGQPTLRKGSNCYCVVMGYLRNNPWAALEDMKVIPGARNRYRSEGFRNVIVNTKPAIPILYPGDVL
mgnify:FL=1